MIGTTRGQRVRTTVRAKVSDKIHQIVDDNSDAGSPTTPAQARQRIIDLYRRDPSQFAVPGVDLLLELVLSEFVHGWRALEKETDQTPHPRPLFTVDGFKYDQYTRWRSEGNVNEYCIMATACITIEQAYRALDLRDEKWEEARLKAGSMRQSVDVALRRAGGNMNARLFDFKD